MDARKYFGITFMTLKDVAEGPLTKVIDRIEEGKYGKLVAVFEDGTAISLNAGNTRTMSATYGWKTEAWPGLAVEMSAGEAEYQGKMQPSVVITPISPALSPAEIAAAVAAAPKTGDGGNDMDDPSPFS